jgi:hypothetical protein
MKTIVSFLFISLGFSFAHAVDSAIEVTRQLYNSNNGPVVVCGQYDTNENSLRSDGINNHIRQIVEQSTSYEIIGAPTLNNGSICVVVKKTR